MLETLNFGASGWGAQLVKGAGLTIFVATTSFILGLFIGILGALCRRVPFAPLRAVVTAYTTVVRGVPELLIIYLLFFGGAATVGEIASLLGIEDFTKVDALIVGILSLTIISGAYSVEVFRGAIQTLPRGQIEAADAFAFGAWNKFRRIMFPQLMRTALPGLGNVWQVTVKDTALISVTGLAELMRVTYIAAGSTHNQFLFYVVAILIFLGITGVSSAIFDASESRLKRKR